MEEILRAEGLKKSFKLSARQQKLEKTRDKTKTAVNDLSFTAYRGEVFGLGFITPPRRLRAFPVSTSLFSFLIPGVHGRTVLLSSAHSNDQNADRKSDSTRVYDGLDEFSFYRIRIIGNHADIIVDRFAVIIRQRIHKKP